MRANFNRFALFDVLRVAVFASGSSNPHPATSPLLLAILSYDSQQEIIVVVFVKRLSQLHDGFKNYGSNTSALTQRL